MTSNRLAIRRNINDPGGMAQRRNWTWEETLVAFRLYCYTSFGKLHQHNPDIIRLAEKLGRTPSAVGMKACNFASLDPLHQARGVVGLKNRGQFEEQVWNRFHDNSEVIAEEAEAAYEQLLLLEEQPKTPVLQAPPGPTEVTRTVQARRVQSFFRSTVLTSYGHRCALTGLAVPSLLNASHIIPWSVSHERRADPCNGICLNALHDRAFDRGLITFDNDLRLVISPTLHNHGNLGDLASTLIDSAGTILRAPDRFEPARETLAYHRERIFQDT